MSNTVNDLLDEVEQLDNATQDLEAQADAKKLQNEQFETAKIKAGSEAHLIALETTKVAQEAAQESQKAANQSIKQAEQLKAGLMEISESNYNWRNNLRTSVDAFKKSQSTIAKLAIFTAFISVSTVAAVIYFLDESKKHVELAKGEMLDILRTENALLQKGITLKLDELSYVIETVQQQQMEQQEAARKLAMTTSKMNEAEKEMSSKDVMPSAEMSDATTEAMPAADTKAMNDSSLPKEHSSQPAQDTNDMPDVKQQSTDKPNAMQAENHSDMNTIHQEIAALKTQISELLSQTKSGKHTSPAQLTKAANKKLNDISYLVRKQSKSITALESQMKKSPSSHKAYQSVESELKAIKQQQLTMSSELKKIQKDLEYLSKMAKEPAPYSYRAR